MTEPVCVNTLASQYGTPLYLLNVASVVNAMAVLQNGLREQYENAEVTYSVKTNSLKAILRKVLESGFRLEVVSTHELELARSVGAGSKDLLFNGPVKSIDALKFCYKNEIQIHVDSIDELKAASLIGSSAEPFPIGIRVAAQLSNGETSRFGVDFQDGESIAAVKSLCKAGAIRISGLHMHHSSRRDTDSYCQRIDRLAAVADMLSIEPDFLDIGGGVSSVPPPEIAAQLAYPIDPPGELARLLGLHVRAKYGESGPRLILEPGIGVLAPCMTYLTRVVATKLRSGKQIAIVDGSLFDVNPLRSRVTPPCRVLAECTPQQEKVHSVQLYGATCMEIDLIGTIECHRELQVGDLVEVSNVGAYSSTLSPEFIIPQAAVYSLDADQLVRERQSDGSYSNSGRWLIESNLSHPYLDQMNK